MDSAKTTQDEGTFWAPEDRSWLWYNDTIETHAFALRTLTELEPDDARRHGLVQWLLLNKKLNHWKSTRATAEVIYALIHYLEREGALGVREEATVVIGSRDLGLCLRARRVHRQEEPDRGRGRRSIPRPCPPSWWRRRPRASCSRRPPGTSRPRSSRRRPGAISSR